MVAVPAAGPPLGGRGSGTRGGGRRGRKEGSGPDRGTDDEEPGVWGCSDLSGVMGVAGARQGLPQLLLLLVRPHTLHAAPWGAGPGDQTVLRAPDLPSVWIVIWRNIKFNVNTNACRRSKVLHRTDPSIRGSLRLPLLLAAVGGPAGGSPGSARTLPEPGLLVQREGRLLPAPLRRPGAPGRRWLHTCSSPWKGLLRGV